MLLCTDGVTEARTVGGELFGLDRLADLLEREAASGRTAEELLRRLVRFVLDHRAGGLRDDATLLSAGRVAVWPKRGRTPSSKRVMARTRVPDKVKTISPTSKDTPACGSRTQKPDAGWPLALVAITRSPLPGMDEGQRHRLADLIAGLGAGRVVCQALQQEVGWKLKAKPVPHRAGRGRSAAVPAPGRRARQRALAGIGAA